MATRKVIKAVLGNFLGTYLSRYSEFDGHWLFGFLVGDLNDFKIDLLQQKCVADLNSPLALAKLLAVTKFDDQRRKAGLAISQIQQATLTIRRMPEKESGTINGHLCVGFKVKFLAEAVMSDGRHYKKEQLVFVAPHDPKVELKSARNPQGSH